MCRWKLNKTCESWQKNIFKAISMDGSKENITNSSKHIIIYLYCILIKKIGRYG